MRRCESRCQVGYCLDAPMRRTRRQVETPIFAKYMIGSCGCVQSGHVVEFFAHQFRVMSILSTHFAHLKSSQDKRERRELSGEINKVLDRSEDIMVKLNGIIPGMDKLISASGEELIDWINGDDHIHAP